MKNLIQALVAASLLATATFAAAAPQKVEQLPRVVITGKSVQTQQVVQLPRVVIEGRSKSEVARDYGLSRYWVHQLVKRYETEGAAAFTPSPTMAATIAAPRAGGTATVARGGFGASARGFSSSSS